MAQEITWPPAAVHSSALDLVTQPSPLQPLSPLHSLVAVLHSERPLQPFTPAHFTPASWPALAVSTTVPAVRIANAVAAARVPSCLRFIRWSPLRVGCSPHETVEGSGTLQGDSAVSKESSRRAP